MYTLYVILRADGFGYKHGYPCGQWNPLPKCQFYVTRSAASRQADKIRKSLWAANLGDIAVKKVLLSLGDA